MAADEGAAGEKTEEATPERKEEARDKGQIATSRELSSVAVLAACILFVTAYIPSYVRQIERMMVTTFESIATRRIDRESILGFAFDMWSQLLWIIIPIFVIAFLAAGGATLLQTRFAWSWGKLKPDFSRLDPLQGILRIANMQAVVELLKSLGKMLAVGLVAYLILKSEWARVPELMSYPIMSSWKYWGGITKQLFWSVAGVLLVIGSADFLYNWRKQDQQLKMSKQELKEDYKRREGDPMIKRRRERFAREMLNRKVLEKTKDATVLITNPTHYSIALKYELGMDAPILLVKGIDHLALQMREVAKDKRIPIIENRPLARELYATVEEGQEIPSKLYKAVAEIIRYVFRLKNRPLRQKKPQPQTT